MGKVPPKFVYFQGKIMQVTTESPTAKTGPLGVPKQAGGERFPPTRKFFPLIFAHTFCRHFPIVLQQKRLVVTLSIKDNSEFFKSLIFISIGAKLQKLYRKQEASFKNSNFCCTKGL